MGLLEFQMLKSLVNSLNLLIEALVDLSKFHLQVRLEDHLPLK